MLELLHLMEGARNCINYLDVKKGENVLIHTDTTGHVHPLVIEAIALAAEEAGGEVSIAVHRTFQPRLNETPPRNVVSAMQNSDKLITMMSPDHAAFCHAGKTFGKILFEYGVPMISVIAVTPDELASEWARFPPELEIAIAQKVLEQYRQGRTFGLTDPNGTDLSGELNPRHIVLGLMNVDEGRGLPGWTFFPRGAAAWHPEGDVRGTFVFELMEPFKGRLKTPVRLTVENHRVTHVEGGAEAAWLRKMMEKHNNGDYVAEMALGTNPKASVSRGLQRSPDLELCRRSGIFHIGVGKATGLGSKVYSDMHIDGAQLRPTLRTDKGTIIEDGRLTALDDPEVRKLAATYGDPDLVLAEVP